jgi:hypothetical protein
VIVSGLLQILLKLHTCFYIELKVHVRLQYVHSKFQEGYIYFVSYACTTMISTMYRYVIPFFVENVFKSHMILQKKRKTTPEQSWGWTKLKWRLSSVCCRLCDGAILSGAIILFYGPQPFILHVYIYILWQDIVWRIKEVNMTLNVKVIQLFYIIRCKTCLLLDVHVL